MPCFHCTVPVITKTDFDVEKIEIGLSSIKITKLTIGVCPCHW